MSTCGGSAHSTDEDDVLSDVAEQQHLIDAAEGHLTDEALDVLIETLHLSLDDETAPGSD